MGVKNTHLTLCPLSPYTPVRRLIFKDFVIGSGMLPEEGQQVVL